MRQTREYWIAVCVLACCAPIPLAAQQPKPLTVVYENNDFQLTGVTVSKSGRMFVNFPRWSDRYQNAVLEVMKDGSTKPYPDEYWNRWDKKGENAGKQFVCVQSVVADDHDSLWVVDAASPLMAGVVAGGPKVVRIDLKTNQVSRVYRLGPGTATPKSYLNDIRIDNAQNTAYLTDSGAGGIVVLDLNSGNAHRALDGHASVRPEPGVSISVNGKPVVGSNGQPPQIASDGIALSHSGDYLYYQALTGATLYRIDTSLLRDPSATVSAHAAGVEKVQKTFPVDGIWMDAQDRIYLSGITQSAVFRITGGKMEKVAADSRLEWPDTFAQGPDDAIYITASHINDSPQYNGGVNTRKKPYAVFRFTP